MRISDWSSDVCSSDLQRAADLTEDFERLFSFREPSACPSGADHQEGAGPYARDLPLALDLVPSGVKRAIIMHDVISSLRLVIHFQEADRASFPAAVNYRMQRLSMAGDRKSTRLNSSH